MGLGGGDSSQDWAVSGASGPWARTGRAVEGTACQAGNSSGSREGDGRSVRIAEHQATMQPEGDKDVRGSPGGMLFRSYSIVAS